MDSSLPNPSKLTLYTDLLVLIGSSIAALGYFLVAAIELFLQLQSLPAAVTFDKGAFYLFGVGLGLAVLIFAIVHESVLRRPLSGPKTSAITLTGMLAVAITIILPQVVHYVTDATLTQHDYVICEQASHQWLHSKTIVYIRNAGNCDALVK